MERNKIGFLTELQDLLETRKKDRPEGSYTTRLFDKGTDKIAQKVGEEAVETVIAAKNNNEELRYEASDLLFHLMVLLTDRGMRIEDLVEELESRHK
jgi:phosphoribosyl-ATP pyrophosphohydrolase/phosphoribosyl-AMP cyclohydrolase